MDLEEAVDRARSFLRSKAGYYYATLESAKLEDGVWNLEFDVGFLQKIIVKVKIDDKTGRVIEYGKR
ncbi:MAG: hypothetical protein DRJ60_05895 [Thermoprotei archaeon]|nr:MAG: hypothetical protein DRJ60_05895 [Thermoprotei archaeon]